MTLEKMNCTIGRRMSRVGSVSQGFRGMVAGAVIALVAGMWPATASAQTGGGFDLTWNTFDGGGGMFSTGGAFSVGGTIGQPDAGPTTGPMSGGAFSVIGGFWPVSFVCNCAGDLNGDGVKNGLDIQKFLDCEISSGVGNCTCADMDGVGGVTLSDVGIFVSDLLSGVTCP